MVMMVTVLEPHSLGGTTLKSFIKNLISVLRHLPVHEVHNCNSKVITAWKYSASHNYYYFAGTIQIGIPKYIKVISEACDIIFCTYTVT